MVLSQRAATTRRTWILTSCTKTLASLSRLQSLIIDDALVLAPATRILIAVRETVARMAKVVAGSGGHVRGIDTADQHANNRVTTGPATVPARETVPTGPTEAVRTRVAADTERPEAPSTGGGIAAVEAVALATPTSVSTTSRGRVFGRVGAAAERSVQLHGK